MKRGTRILHREAVRHALASIVALALTLGILVLARPILVGGDPERWSSLMGPVLFGVYGPIFLAVTALAFRGLHGEGLRAHVMRSDERSRLVRWLFLIGPKSWAILVATAGVLSVVLLATGGAGTNLPLVLVCVAGVAGSWVLLVAVFAVEYMRGWAATDGIVFPGSEPRTFRDFLYLSVQQSTTFSSSDVQLVLGSARSLAMVHSVVAFGYSSAIIAVFASLLVTITS